ncbi:MAG: response regulator transcription factor [Solirubrobacterales bacterium]|nr:response regulator transcription factor [Solirubrobacterales bacterium]
MEADSEGRNEGARILVVEDDREIVDVLRRTLRADGFTVEGVEGGGAALELAPDFLPDLVILDLGLPDIDGEEVCRQLRLGQETARVPILMLTARTELDDRVSGLDSGADDYLTKPFEREEILARIRALLRRTPPRGSAVLKVGDLRLAPDAREVSRDGRDIDLTKTEFELLEYLMRNERLVISRETLLEEVWEYDLASGDTNTLDVFISNLRRKLEEGGEPRMLHTKRGSGYVLKA